MFCRRHGIQCEAEQMVASQEGLFCMTFIFVHCYEFESYIGDNFQRSCNVNNLMAVYTIPCHDSRSFNVVLILQICSDSQHILPGPSSDTNAVSFDWAYHVGNARVEGDLDMQMEEELKVKTENGVGSEEEECIDIKDEESLYSEEEVKEEHIVIKEEDIDIEKEEHQHIKKEVSLECSV